MSNTIQNDLFAGAESDHWFQRNKASMQNLTAEKDCIIRMIQTYNLRPKKILEVGASNGSRVALLAKAFSAKGLAVEPSQEAVNDGKTRYPHIAVERGMAHEIPTKESFDLTIINGVFCWIDRALLLRSIAEIDRCTDNGGYLVIGDFLPNVPSKVRYHHVADEAYTYKQNYAAAFLASSTYELVATQTVAHNTWEPSIEPPEGARWGVWLLRKNVTGVYVERTIPT